MGAALKYKQDNVAKQAGEVARLKVVQGPDRGSVYVLTNNRVSIGRGDECDVVLSDLRTSRRHAELVRGPSGWSVQDLGSANGIAHNGHGVKNSPVQSKDTISLGETVLEFVSAEAGTLVLVSSAPSPQQIQAEQAGMAAQKAKIQAMAKVGGLAKNTPQIGPAPARSGGGFQLPFNAPAGFDPKRLLLIGAVLVAGYFLMNESSSPVAKKTGKKVEEEQARDLASYLPPAESEALERTADMFFKSGFREYRVGNYLRAKMQFENVLQIAPNHGLAKLYLSHSNQRLEEEVKDHLSLGRKDLEAGKLKSARGHYEAVLRILFRDQTSPAYVEASDQLKRVIEEERDS